MIFFEVFDEEKPNKTTRNDSTRGRYFSLLMCVLKLNYEGKFLPIINHRLHLKRSCVTDQRSVYRIKILDSFELKADKFLIYLLF